MKYVFYSLFSLISSMYIHTIYAATCPSIVENGAVIAATDTEYKELLYSNEYIRSFYDRVDNPGLQTTKTQDEINSEVMKWMIECKEQFIKEKKPFEKKVLDAQKEIQEIQIQIAQEPNNKQLLQDIDAQNAIVQENREQIMKIDSWISFLESTVQSSLAQKPLDLNRFRPGNPHGYSLFEDATNPRSDRNIMNRVIRLMLQIIPTIAVFLVIYNGFQYMLSSLGGSNKGGTSGIENALIGMVIAFMSYMIVQFMLSVLFKSISFV